MSSGSIAAITLNALPHSGHRVMPMSKLRSSDRSLVLACASELRVLHVCKISRAF